MGSERDHLDPALTASPIIDTTFGRVGLYSCMDGVINETPRMLAVGGAQVLLNSLNSFALDEASLHVPVRAVENRVWVVAANKVGPLVPARSIVTVAERVGVPVEMLHGAGESQIVAPDGTVVAMAPRTGEAVIVADIEIGAADDKRRPDGTDVMGSRRPDLYGPILDVPRGRRRAAGADELITAIVNPAEGDDLPALLVEALATGAGLVVLPELAEVAPDLIVAALVESGGAGSEAYVATSVAEGDVHVGLVLSADGVVLRQPQLHPSARHGWATALGDGLVVADLPWGRLALIVGDDALYPEAFRLAVLQDVDVVAVPFTTQAGADLDPLLLERAAENRLNVAVASRQGEYGGGALFPLSTDFTLWAPDRGPFVGIISRPGPGHRLQLDRGGDASSCLRGQPLRQQGHRPGRRPALGAGPGAGRTSAFGGLGVSRGGLALQRDLQGLLAAVQVGDPGGVQVLGAARASQVEQLAVLADASLGGLRRPVDAIHQQVEVAVGGVPEDLQHAAVGGTAHAVEQRGVEGVVSGGQGGRLPLDAGVLVEGDLGLLELLLGHLGHRAHDQVALDQLAQPVDVGEVLAGSARRPGRTGPGGD